jgi:hypothetical protein
MEFCPIFGKSIQNVQIFTSMLNLKSPKMCIKALLKPQNTCSKLEKVETAYLGQN